MRWCSNTAKSGRRERVDYPHWERAYWLSRRMQLRRGLLTRQEPPVFPWA